jgi:GntR family transcriptional regulator, trigonelline degradation regulator
MKPAERPSPLRVARHRPTLRTQVVERLRTAMLDSRFRPGDRLIEPELCRLTGVSRSVVREALRQLEAEGLVETRPDRGPAVVAVSPDDAAGICESCAAVLGFAARLVAERGSEALHDELVAILSEAQAAAAHDATRLHEAILSGCGNAVLQTIGRSLLARVALLQSDWQRQPANQAKWLGELHAIVAAIRRRDADAAQAAGVAYWIGKGEG